MPLDVRGSIELRRVRMSNTGSTDEAPGRPTTPPELRVEHHLRLRRRDRLYTGYSAAGSIHATTRPDAPPPLSTINYRASGSY